MRVMLLCAIAICSAPLQAQEGSDAFTSLPAVEPPPRDFASAEEHYRFLYDQADGGTQHSMESIPVWDGLWGAGNNTMPALFLVDGHLGITMSPGSVPREGVLTPPYEAQFKALRAEMEELGRVRFDRLTRCEYPGMPRWLWEPYIKEFANLPKQTWMMNDFMNEMRRIYINAEHVNIDAQHSATGDSIGFWDENKLIIWTKWVNPADYLRGMPLTSNQFEAVETWYERTFDDGSKQLVTQVTFYDPIALVQPLSAVYTHHSRPDLEGVGVRMRNWECATSSNSYMDEDGNTQFYLPGDPEYKDPRGTTDFPDLPGQSRNPMYEN